MVVLYYTDLDVYLFSVLDCLISDTHYCFLHVFYSNLIYMLNGYFFFYFP